MGNIDKKELMDIVDKKIQAYVNRILKGTDESGVMQGSMDAEVYLETLLKKKEITKDYYDQAIALIEGTREKRLSELGLSKKHEDAISHTEALKDVAAVKRASVEKKDNNEISEDNIPDPSKSGSRGSGRSGPD